ncbi:MAG: PH domain-containing protein [Candidatus Diapherotrites archaeon]|nr:PH domain-containing protein [Candidatus Diapherotrites archaeon]
MENRPFNLQEGEKIIKEIKPVGGLLWYWLVPGIILFLLIGIFFTPLIFGGIFSGSPGGLLWTVFSLGFVGIILIPLLGAFWRYNKQHYWITNKRIIQKSGFIGYKVNSIPLERISDAIISRSFAESIFGFGSVHIQSLAGQITYNNRFGAEGSLLAVPDPEGTQELIFGLIGEKRKREKLSF